MRKMTILLIILSIPIKSFALFCTQDAEKALLKHVVRVLNISPSDVKLIELEADFFSESLSGSYIYGVTLKNHPYVKPYYFDVGVELTYPSCAKPTCKIGQIYEAPY